MSGYDEDMRGVLFQNDKGDNPKRPDYVGKVTVQGLEYEIAGWKKLSKANKPYLSLSIQEKREKPAVDQVYEDIESQEVNLDDIPF